MDNINNNTIVDVTTMVGKFKSRLELQGYAEKLFLGLKQCLEKVKKLEEDNLHLQQLLDASTPSIKFVIPDEQAIAEIQLERLKVYAMERDLTLDETKRFDILTKNLYLSKGKPKHVPNRRISRT